jgi:hypothetical protein
MTNKQLINLLLDFPMESEVNIRFELPDIELDYEQFEVERSGGIYSRNENPYLTVKIKKELDEDIIKDGVGYE